MVDQVELPTIHIPDQPEPVSIAPDSVQTPSTDTTTARAYMFQHGLGHVVGSSTDQLQQQLADGQEPAVRRQAAAALDQQHEQLKFDLTRQALLSGQASPHVIAKINQPTQPTNPDTVAELAYGHQFINNASTASSGAMRGTPYAQAKSEIPKQVQDTQRIYGENIGRRQYAVTLMQDVQDDLANQGWGGWLSDQAKSFVPFYDEVKLRGWLDNTSSMSGLGLGNNLDEETTNLLQMPMDQYSTTLKGIVDKLKQDNPAVAAQFLQAVIGQSTTDKFLNNLTTAMDLTSIPGTGLAGKFLLRKAGLANEVRDVAKDMAKATRYSIGPNPPVDELGNIKDIPEGAFAEKPAGDPNWYIQLKEHTAAAAGDTEEAGIQKSVKNLSDNLKGNTQKTNQAIEALTSALRADNTTFAAAAGHGGQEIANRINLATESLISNITDLVANARRVDRLPEVMAQEVSVRAIAADIKDSYKGISNSITDVIYKGMDETASHHVFEVNLMNPDGTPFNQWIQAQHYKKLTGQTDAEVVKEGMGYKLVWTHNMDEESKVVRDLIGNTNETRLQQTWFNGYVNGTIGWLRTPKEVLSIEENMQRELATHGPSVLLGLVKEGVKEIQKLPKGLPFTKTRRYWDEWNRAIDYARYAEDPNNMGAKGHFFENGQEMDDHWLRYYQRLPEENEKAAYFAVKRNVEMNRIFTVMEEYKNKAAWGGKQHRISYVDEKTGKKVTSDFFEGKNHPTMPTGDDTYYVQQGKGEGATYRGGSARFVKLQNLLKAKVESGQMKVVEIWNTEHRPLSTYGSRIGDAKIRYVLTDNVETKALDWNNQVNRRGGGHFIYDYDHYIKQANIKSDTISGVLRHYYEGDTTVMPMNIRAAAQDIAKHLNQVREHIKNNDFEAAERYNNANLPIKWEEHRGWYEPSKDPQGRPVGPRLNTHEPFYVVPKNKSIIDMDSTLEKRYGNQFKDGTRQGNAARQHMVEFTGERDAHDLMTIRPSGTRWNPIYNYEPAKLVDPIPSMNRAMNQIVKSFFMNDMKAYSVKHFLKEAENHMDVPGGIDAIMHSPYYYFNNFKNYLRSSTDFRTANTLKAAHYMIGQFQGVPNKTETFLHSVTQSLADTIYRGAGAKVVPSWMLADVRDPASYVRSLTVHLKLGLFNLPSFFVQASTFTNVMGIAGLRHAGPAAVATLLHTWSRINRNPAILAKLDEYASKMGWRPGEWLEANEELARRGFRNVGHEHALVDAPYTNKVVQTKFGQLLDAGHIFFKEGAESIRTAAWYAAHHEYRYGRSGVSEAKATGRLTKRDWDHVLARAADLDHNMSRAGNSAVQSGALSFPMQFVTYSTRLTELMTGKRLTRMEKARLFLTSSIMYGLPFGGLGLYGGALPAGDTINKWAKSELGYEPGQGFFSDTVMNGLPAAAIQSFSGSMPNIAQRYGTKGIDPLEETLAGDQAWWKIVGGATASTFANTFDNASGLIKAAGSFISGRQDEFPVTGDDFADIASEWSEFSNIRKMLAGIHTGHVVSKNGSYLGDTSPLQSILSSITGLSDVRVANIHNTFDMEQAEKANYKWAEGKAIKELRRYFQSTADNDPQQADKYMTKAKAYMDSVGYPERMRAQVWAAAGKGFAKSLVDTSDFEYLRRNVPQGQEDARREQLYKIQNIQRGNNP